MTQFGQCVVRGGLRKRFQSPYTWSREKKHLLSLMGRTLYFHWTCFILIPTLCGPLLKSTWVTSFESGPVGLGSSLGGTEAGSIE